MPTKWYRFFWPEWAPSLSIHSGETLKFFDRTHYTFDVVHASSQRARLEWRAAADHEIEELAGEVAVGRWRRDMEA